MIQILAFTITAILLYVFSDWLLVKLEQLRGKPFAARSLVFLMIIMLLSVGAFEGLQRFLPTLTAQIEHNQTPNPASNEKSPDSLSQ